VALSGRLLPLHLKPLPDEQLSSWLVRLAHSHGATLSSFCWQLWPQHALWNCDLDRVFDVPTLMVLAERTATPYERVLETTLRAFEGKVVARFSTSASPLWLLPPGLLYRVRPSHGFQFCSRCLAADPTPYFRRRWRLACTTVCLDHNCRLLDACPHCGAPVTLRRSSMTIPCRWRCHHCHGHLAKGAMQQAVADPAVVAFQSSLMEGLEIGEVQVGNNRIDTLTFFEGLHPLWRVCATEAIAQSQGVTRQSHRLYDAATNPERLRIAIRYETMRLLFEMLAEHPEQFMALCQAIRPGNEKRPRHLFPPSSWYWSLVFWHFDPSHPMARRSQ
jgi:ribosomal protein L37AE/L43A